MWTFNADFPSVRTYIRMYVRTLHARCLVLSSSWLAHSRSSSSATMYYSPKHARAARQSGALACCAAPRGLPLVVVALLLSSKSPFVRLFGRSPLLCYFQIKTRGAGSSSSRRRMAALGGWVVREKGTKYKMRRSLLLEWAVYAQHIK